MEITVEDLNALTARMQERYGEQINDLRLTVNEHTTQLKYINENSQNIHLQGEKLNEVNTKVQLLEKDLSILQDEYKRCSVGMQQKIEELSQIKDQYQELRGEINQIRMFVEELKENKKGFRNSFVWPLLVAVLMFALSSLFTVLYTYSKGYAIKTQTPIEQTSRE